MKKYDLLPNNLGNIDASYDQILPSTFVTTHSYDEVLQKDKFIITGRKGVGKTALARMLPEREKNNVQWNKIILSDAPEIFFDDLSSDFRNNNSLSKLSTSEFMKQMWEHFIVESCMKVVLDELDNRDDSKDIALIKKYLESVGQLKESKLSNIASFFANMLDLITPELELDKVKISVGSGEKIMKIFEKKHNYIEALTSLKVVLENNNYNILFLIDDIDEHLDKYSNEEIFKPFVEQLIMVSRSLNYGNASANIYLGDCLTIKVFLPTDVYSWLEMRHTDKFRSHRMELLWKDSELKEMFRKRLLELGRLKKLSLEDLLNNYFGEGVYDTYGKRRDLLGYIIENTFGRPRDIMNIYSQLKYYLRNHSLYTDNGYYAIADYVSETIQSIISEYSFVQPNLDYILQGFVGANAVLKYSDVYQIVLEKNANVISEQEVDKIINTLYEIGLFGLMSRDKNPFYDNLLTQKTPIHSLKVEYCYNKRTTLRTLKRSDSHLVIHPIFRYEYSIRNNLSDYLKEVRGF
jgi:hypothetical protein